MSIDSFANDFLTDLHEYRDFIYDWGVEGYALDSSVLCHVVYSLINEYLHECLSFLPYGALNPSPHDVTFLPKLGWRVSSPIGVSYLGKVLPSKGSHLYLGASTYLAGINRIWGTGALHIGSYCSIGPGNTFYTSDDSHPSKNLIPININANQRSESFGLSFLNPDYSYFHSSSGFDTLTIGHGVWIGRNCNLKRSSFLRNGVYLGEGSWVNKTLSSYSLYCGAPARFIRLRFQNCSIDKLDASCWWTYSPKDIESNDYLRNLFEVNLDNYPF